MKLWAPLRSFCLHYMNFHYRYVLAVVMIDNQKKKMFIVITTTRKLIKQNSLCPRRFAGVSCNRCGIRIFFTETKSSAANITIAVMLGAHQPRNRKYRWVHEYFFDESFAFRFFFCLRNFVCYGNLQCPWGKFFAFIMKAILLFNVIYT